MYIADVSIVSSGPSLRIEPKHVLTAKFVGLVAMAVIARISLSVSLLLGRRLSLSADAAAIVG